MNYFNHKFFWGGIFLVYPFVIYLFIDEIDLSFWVAILGLLLFSRFGIPYFWQKRTISRQEKLVAGGGFILGAGFLGLCAVFGKGTFYYYPVLVSLTMAGVFFSSLLSSQSLIERIARLTDPDLDEQGVRYTRKVTISWGVFCLLNALVSYGTIVFGNEDIWVVYNGVISYVLMGVLFGVEYSIRRFVKGMKE